MINILKIITAYFFVKIGFVKHLILKNEPIVSYHNVIPDEYYDAAVHLGVSHKYSIFVKQIETIKKFLSINNFQSRLLITFDDGYRNNYEIVKDFISKQGVKVIFFISPNRRINDEMFWIDKLLYASSYLKPSIYEVNNKSFVLNDNNRFDFQSKIYDLICKNYEDKDNIIEKLYQKAINIKNKCPKDSDYFNIRFKFMTEEEIFELSKLENIKIGYHTRNHDNLVFVSKTEFYKELNEEKEFLLKFNVKDFAFPFGGKDEINTVHISSVKYHGMEDIYSNTNLLINENIKPRTGIPNVSNSYLILAYYSGLFNQLKKLFLFKD
tara:strand:+ start:16 stop:987 length:972 start_codon:yes stop_codon:yes gene_type:complete